MKTLVIFDFDDTLFESQSKIVVKSPRGVTKYLSSGEYASYTPEHDDELDFSQFEEYPPNPRPIVKTVKKLRHAVLKYGLENVIILTARRQSKPISEVLQNFELPQIFIAAVGSSEPNVKANYAAMTVEEEGYENVIVYEDNVRNIAAIKNAVLPLVGNRNFTAYNVRQQNDDHILVRH